MTRREQYAEFQKCLFKLLRYAWARDIIVKGVEWWRSWEKAAEYAAKGVGIKNSKHCYSLAVDLYVVGKTGKEVLIAKTPEEKERYRVLGVYWESLGMTWGGNFRTRYDPFHFEYGGKPA